MWLKAVKENPPSKYGVESVPRLTIGKYRTSKDDCIIPAEFTISFDNVEKGRFDGVFSKYRVLYVDYDENKLSVRVPVEDKFIPAAAAEIEKLIDYACLLEEGGMEICGPAGLKPRFDEIPASLPGEEYSGYGESVEEYDQEIGSEDFVPDYAEIPTDLGPEFEESLSFDELEDMNADLLPEPDAEETVPVFDEVSPDEIPDFAGPEEFSAGELPEEGLNTEFPGLSGEETPVLSETGDAEEIFSSEDFPLIEDLEAEFDHEEVEVPGLDGEPGVEDVISVGDSGELPVPGEESPGFEVTDEFADLEEIVEASGAGALLEEAEGFVFEGRYEDAIYAFRSVLEQDPGNTAALTGMVSVMYESGQPEMACEAFSENEMLLFAGSDLCFTAGRAFEDLGRMDEAAECYKRALEADPDDIGVIERYAVLLTNGGRYEDAVNVLGTSVLEKYGSADLWIRRGDICVMAEKAADALESYEKALEMAPENRTAMLSMLRLLKENERYGEAAGLLDSYLKTHPEDSHLWFEKGWFSEKGGDNEEALLDYDQAVSLDAGCTRAVACKALLLMREKRPDEALECYDLLIERKPDNAAVHHSRGLVLKVLGRYDEALGSFKEAIRLDPSDMDTLIEIAELSLGIGRFEDALGYYKRLIESGVSGADVLTGQGDAYKALGMAAEALDAYENATKAGGDISRALKGKAAILAASGRTDEAEETYNAVLEMIPSDTAVLLGLASLYEDAGRPEQALSAYERLLITNPADASALYGRIRNLEVLGRYSEALPSYDSLLVTHPDRPDLVSGKAFSLAKTGRREEAVILYISALEMEPENTGYLIELVTLLSDLGRYEESLPYYDRLIRLVPGESGFVMSRALALLTLRRYEDAVGGFEDVLLSHPNDTDALLNMGVALLRLGDRRGAMECYKRSIDVDPAFGEEWSRRGIEASSFIEWELERIQKVSESSPGRRRRPQPVKPEPEAGREMTEEPLHETEILPSGVDSMEKSVYVPDVKMPTKEQLNDPDYLYRKGLGLARKGYYRAALKCFTRVESMTEDSSEAVFSKGIIYAKNGYYREAVECFDRVIEMNPSHEKAQKAKKMAEIKKKKKS